MTNPVVIMTTTGGDQKPAGSLANPLIIAASNGSGGVVVDPTTNTWNYAAASGGIVNTTTAVTIKTAAGAGLRNYLTGFDLSTDGALGAATEIVVRDGAGGTVLWRKKINATAGLPGMSVTFPSPLKSTANTLLEVATLTASITGAVYFNAQGYVGA